MLAETLGLTPSDSNPGGLVFTTEGGTQFFLYETEYAGQAGHTIAQWHVDDVGTEVKELRDRGLYIEDYCIHNDGGKAVFNVIFHPADPMQDYMTEDKGFAYLESRIEYNYNRDYHVANLDSWSPTDPE